MLLQVFKMCISEVEIIIIQKKKRKSLTCLGQESIPDLKMTKNVHTLKSDDIPLKSTWKRDFKKFQRFRSASPTSCPHSKVATRPNCVVCLWKASNTVDWSWLECDEHVTIPLVLCIFFQFITKWFESKLPIGRWKIISKW